MDMPHRVGELLGLVLPPVCREVREIFIGMARDDVEVRAAWPRAACDT